MITAREDLIKAKTSYHLNPTENERAIAAENRNNLETCYTVVEEEIVNDKIHEVENTADIAGSRTKLIFALMMGFLLRRFFQKVRYKLGKSDSVLQCYLKVHKIHIY
jgi:hypothetical protein